MVRALILNFGCPSLPVLEGWALDSGSVRRIDAAIAHLDQNLDEEILGASRSEERQAPVATKGDGVEMVLPVTAFQLGRHEQSNHDSPLKSIKDGAPQNRYGNSLVI